MKMYFKKEHDEILSYLTYGLYKDYDIVMVVKDVKITGGLVADVTTSDPIYCLRKIFDILNEFILINKNISFTDKLKHSRYVAEIWVRSVLDLLEDYMSFCVANTIIPFVLNIEMNIQGRLLGTMCDNNVFIFDADKTIDLYENVLAPKIETALIENGKVYDLNGSDWFNLLHMRLSKVITVIEQGIN